MYWALCDQCGCPMQKGESQDGYTLWYCKRCEIEEELESQELPENSGFDWGM